MILVTVGTQKFPMNRLVEAMDQMAEHTEETIFIQTGNSTYEPQHCESQKFVDAAEFKKMIEECSVLVTHSGVGSIMTGIHAEKPIVVVPRKKEFHEHVDDHQVQIAEAFAVKQCVLHCDDVKELPDYIERARMTHFEPYIECEGKIEDMIIEYIEKL